MKLESLHIELGASYTDYAGKYRGKMTWVDDKGSEIKMILPESFSETLLQFIAPVLEEQAKQTATHFVQAVQQSVLEAKGVTLQLKPE
jgi:hypothetical protein